MWACPEALWRRGALLAALAIGLGAFGRARFERNAGRAAGRLVRNRRALSPDPRRRTGRRWACRNASARPRAAYFWLEHAARYADFQRYAVRDGLRCAALVWCDHADWRGGIDRCLAMSGAGLRYHQKNDTWEHRLERFKGFARYAPRISVRRAAPQRAEPGIRSGSSRGG